MRYEVEADAPLEALFTTEWNLAFLTGSLEYVRLQAGGGERVAGGSRNRLRGVKRLDIRDDLRDADLTVEFDPPCDVWTYPLETASQSEEGLERVFQGTTLVAVWELKPDGVAVRSFSMSLRSPGAGGVQA